MAIGKTASVLILAGILGAGTFGCDDDSEGDPCPSEACGNVTVMNILRPSGDALAEGTYTLEIEYGADDPAVLSCTNEADAFCESDQTTWEGQVNAGGTSIQLSVDPEYLGEEPFDSLDIVISLDSQEIVYGQYMLDWSEYYLHGEECGITCWSVYEEDIELPE